MPIKRTRRRRIVRDNQGRGMNHSATPEPVLSSGTKKVLSHPWYDKIVRALHEGASVMTIAAWLDDSNMLDGVTANTFVQYLYVFKKEMPHTYNKVLDDASIRGGVDAQDVQVEDIIGVENAPIDTLIELDKTIRLQKKRIALATTNELRIGMLLDTNHKAVEKLGELLKLRAEVLKQVDPMTASVGTSGALRSVIVDQGERDTMAGLVSSFMDTISHADPDRKKKKAVNQS